MAGYALAKIEMTGKRIVFMLMVILLMVADRGADRAALVVGLGDGAHQHIFRRSFLPPLANPLGAILMRQFILACRVISSMRRGSTD